MRPRRTELRRYAVLVCATAVTVGLGDPALAYTGSIEGIHRVAEGTWKANFSTTPDPCGPPDSCGGFSTAFSQPAARACEAQPYDASYNREVWFTDTQDPLQPVSEWDAFPASEMGDTRLCLYVYRRDFHLVADVVFNPYATTPPVPSDTGEPSFTARSRTERSRARQVFSARGDGCFGMDDRPDEQLWEYTSDQSCVLMRLRVRRGRKTIIDGPIRDQRTLRWSCASAGSYRWTVDYTNSSEDAVTRRSRSGRFEVPRCRR